jgi:hypothetical protein
VKSRLVSERSAEVQSLCALAVRSWYLRPGTLREPGGKGASAVEAATK